MKIGLTLGKFAPFHLGHKLIVDQALAECDKVIVIIYDEPELTNISCHRRANWIRDIYSSQPVEVIEAYGGPKETGYAPHIMVQHEQFILKVLGSREVTHFYSSEPYGEHVSNALGAWDRRVDLLRHKIQVSGTLIRQDPYKYRTFVPDVVYRDLITKVCFLGAESSGKSTITSDMARQYNTTHVTEHGQAFWEEHQCNGVLTQQQLLQLAREHRAIEDNAALHANKYLFVDTNAITTYKFATDYSTKPFGMDIEKELRDLAWDCQKRYDITFLCGIYIPYDDTPDRRGEKVRLETHIAYRYGNLLRNFGVKAHSIDGTPWVRVKMVTDVLTKFEEEKHGS